MSALSELCIVRFILVAKGRSPEEFVLQAIQAAFLSSNRISWRMWGRFGRDWRGIPAHTPHYLEGYELPLLPL